MRIAADVCVECGAIYTPRKDRLTCSYRCAGIRKTQIRLFHTPSSMGELVGNERNDAFAGSWTMGSGDKIRVEYMDRAACERLFNAGVKRNSAGFRKIGWYWTAYRGPDPKASVVATWHGPFSASGVALRDAKDRYAEIGAAITVRTAREPV